MLRCRMAQNSPARAKARSYDAKTREVTWHVGTLGPGDDNYMELKCVLKSPGKNR